MSNPPAQVQLEAANQSASNAENGMMGSSTQRLWVAAILVAAWIVIVNAWTVRHLGWGLENVFGISSLAAGLAAAATLFEKSIPEEELKQLKISLLKIPMTYIVGLWIVFGAISSMRSSVVVLRDLRGDAVYGDGIVLSTVISNQSFAADRRETKDEPVRFSWVPTTPFGRAYRLKVPGYVEQVVQVYPLTGLTVIPERDLPGVSPSVLFRPSMIAAKELDPVSGGKFEVLLVTGNSYSIVDGFLSQELIPRGQRTGSTRRVARDVGDGARYERIGCIRQPIEQCRHNARLAPPYALAAAL